MGFGEETLSNGAWNNYTGGPSVVRKPEVSNIPVLTKLHLGDVPKFHCALSEKWKRQVKELAVKPPAPASMLPGYRVIRPAGGQLGVS